MHFLLQWVLPFWNASHSGMLSVLPGWGHSRMGVYILEWVGYPEMGSGILEWLHPGMGVGILECLHPEMGQAS